MTTLAFVSIAAPLLLFSTVSSIGSEYGIQKIQSNNRKLIADHQNNNYSCAKNQILVRRRETVLGCYNQSSLSEPCETSDQCQSAVANSFCGFPKDEDLESPGRHKCICNKGYQQDSSANGKVSCTPIHRCSTDDFNAEYAQGDCPLFKEYCAKNICLCAPSYRRDLKSRKCVWSVPDSLEPGTLDTGSPNDGFRHYHLKIILFLVMAIVVVVLVGSIFCYLKVKSSKMTKTKVSPKRTLTASHRQFSRQDSASQYTLISNKQFEV